MSYPPASDGPYLSLESFRVVAGIRNQWAFWGFNGDCDCTSNCTHIWTGEPCGDRFSRRELKDAISEAEAIQRAITRIPLGRQWFEETLPAHQLPRVTQQYRYPAIQLGYNRLQAIGKRTYTLLGQMALTYTTADGGAAFPSTPFTAFGQIAGIDPFPPLEEIEIHFIERLDDCPPSNESRVHPVKLTDNAGILEARGRAWLFGQPLHWYGSNEPLDCTLTDSFVEAVEVYHVSSDPAEAVIFDFEPRPDCICPVCVSPEAEASANAGTGGIRNATTGLAYVGWETCCTGCGNADNMTIHYSAGQDSKTWERMVAKLAAGLLPELCEGCCAGVDSNQLSRWMEDLSEQSDSDAILGRRFAVPFEYLNNEYRLTRRGAIEAIAYLRKMQVGRGVAF